MHRLDGGQILVDHAVQRAAALLDVADDAAQNAHIGVGVHEYLHIHQVAQLGGVEDQNTFDNDDRRGLHENDLVAAVVDGVVIHRHLHRVAGAQLPQVGDHQRRVKAVRVVVVQLAALLVGEFVVALVVTVMVDDADLVRTEMIPQLLGQGRLAAAGAACNADDDGFHIHSSLYVQFDLAPGGLIRAVFHAGHVEHPTAGNTGVRVVIFIR